MDESNFQDENLSLCQSVAKLYVGTVYSAVGVVGVPALMPIVLGLEYRNRGRTEKFSIMEEAIGFTKLYYGIWLGEFREGYNGLRQSLTRKTSQRK